MNNFVIGFSYLGAGFHLITRSGLRRFVLIPAFLNLLLFIGLFFLMRYYMHEFNVWISSLLPSWLQWLKLLFWIVFITGFFVFFIYTFVAIGNVIGAPFNSFLSEKVAFFLTGKSLEQRTFVENLKDIPRVIGRQLAILGYYLPRALVLLVLLFIPLVHFIAPILWFLFSAWFMAMTYLDYPSDNQRVSLTALREWMKQFNWLSFGFGCSVLIVSMIPIFNFFVIPAAVAGGTKLWIETNNETNRKFNV